MRFRLNNQDYIRLQTIAFFIPFIKLNKQSNPDNIYKIAYRCAQMDVCVIEADVFDSLSELYKSLNDLFKKNKIYDVPIRIGKQKTSGIELSKQIRVYKSLLSKEKQKKDEVVEKIDSKFYTISDAAQFIVKFSDIIDCYKFSELVKNVDFLQIISDPILTFASYSPRNFPDDFITGIRECVAFLSNHGVDHTKWDSAELKKLIFSCLDVYNKAHKMLKGKCCSDEKAMQKEINRRKKFPKKN